MPTRKNQHHRKLARQKLAEERNVIWEKLSLAQQLAELDKRFGEGKGAQKQRAKILKKLKKNEQ